MSKHYLNFLYLGSALFFILGLKGLSRPETARRGMFQAEFGMLLAIIGTLFHKDIVSYQWIIAGLILGSVIGAAIALFMPMTHVPQRTALSHAGGALAAALIGISEYYRHHLDLGAGQVGLIGFEVMLGSLTTTGSLMAFSKLQGLITSYPITYRGQNTVNITLLTVMLGLIGYLTYHPSAVHVFYVLVGISFLFGILLVLPIGAADMPVLISFLNAYAGLTDAAMGFMLANRIQIITGSLDGSSGLILSILMCRAMNRSILNVLFGAFGKVEARTTAATDHKQPKKLTAEEAAELLWKARSVIVVPGYGMAAAGAQYAIREAADLLKQQGVAIKYAIHPVAGRMPGHMNVLLAEANVPYTELFDMGEINPDFPQTDVALVIGANDVTNPAARYAKGSPIYGMPILDVDKAKAVIVCKRSMAPGFAGIDNELYYLPHTYMLFGDGKSMAEKLVGILKQKATSPS